MKQKQKKVERIEKNKKLVMVQIRYSLEFKYAAL